MGTSTSHLRTSVGAVSPNETLLIRTPPQIPERRRVSFSEIVTVSNVLPPPQPPARPRPGNRIYLRATRGRDAGTYFLIEFVRGDDGMLVIEQTPYAGPEPLEEFVEDGLTFVRGVHTHVIRGELVDPRSVY